MQVFNKILSTMLRPWFIVLYSLFAVCSYFYLDKKIAMYFFSLDLCRNFFFLNWVTNFGSGNIYLLFLPIAAMFFGYVKHNKSLAMKIWMLWLFVLYPSLIAMVLKTVLGRARPVVYFNQDSFGFFGWHSEGEFHSFPSGHTTIITSLCVGLLILFPRYCYYWIGICLLVITSRVLLNYHYLSDVWVSFYLVFLELGLFTYIMRKKFSKTCESVLKW